MYHRLVNKSSHIHVGHSDKARENVRDEISEICPAVYITVVYQSPNSGPLL
jgi:hypothetical protein